MMKKVSSDYYSICKPDGEELVNYANECISEEEVIERCNELVQKYKPDFPYIVVFNEIDTWYAAEEIFERAEYRKYFVVSCSWR